MRKECFKVIVSDKGNAGPRLGRLMIPGRADIDTPSYIANTSRGVIPHLTQDTLARNTGINGVYTSLEDFIEQTIRTPPVLDYVSSSDDRTLRTYLAVPKEKILVLGARRTPPVAPPPATSNTDSAVAISTSTGIRYLATADYAQYAEDLDPDVIVGLADIPVGRALVAKRIEKATDRSIDWLAYHLSNRRTHSSYFASLMPVSCANQQYYIDSLLDDHAKGVDGLAIYSTDSLVDMPAQLQSFPKLDLTEANTPLQILQHIQLGVDLLVLPFVDVATDAGLALVFNFPIGSVTSSEPLPLGLDLWDSAHATDLSALVQDCSCYACTKHHRAYIQHLLNAKEMLGWILLQIHNHHIMALFFEAVRSSIKAGAFEEDIASFSKAYESVFPAKTGQGPRVRGYQRRSERPAEPKINPSAFKKYKDDSQTRPLKSTLPKVPSGLPDDFDIGLLEGALTISED